MTQVAGAGSDLRPESMGRRNPATSSRLIPIRRAMVAMPARRAQQVGA